ncbi:MAG: aminotransferase class I/II-fold pyridoxal phosphate-dependent enzyme [Archaeoglobus sp.]|nr:aminotransferase class I/II-fold pyridoxal phosphate-dependent enzyme [Archaeoglobus sp.]
MKNLRKKLELDRIQELSSHGGREKSTLDFSISVNPYQPEWMKELFIEAEKRSICYPYFEELDRDLSEVVGEDVAITAGATEGIYLSLLLLRDRVKKSIIPQPTYSEYERVSRIFGLKIVKTGLSPKEIAEKLRGREVVFFCNPNNPDGRYFPPKELEPLIEAVEETNSILILDEAFKDFVKNFESPKSENVIKLRTFTKSYGMPGIRVGYVTGFAEEIRALRMPWSIGSVGVAFIERMIEDSFKFLRESIPKVWREKERFEKELNVKSGANYFLLKLSGQALKALKLKGIAVRDCTSFGLPDHIRFCIRKPEENSKLIEAIKECWQDH